MVNDYSRNQPPRSQWAVDRFAPEHLPDGMRYHDVHGARRPLVRIEEALREQCGMPVKAYFVAAILDNGSSRVLSGPECASVPDSEADTFFSMGGYIQYLNRKGTVPGPIDGDHFAQFENDYMRQSAGFQYHSRRGLDRRQIKSDMFEDESIGPPYKARKRPRQVRRDFDDDDAPVPVASARKGIKIGDSEATWQFYDQRFRNCQQTACKLIAKAWVKAVEPKKQSNHPYTGSDEKAPDWWPKPWGPSRDEKVRHKEPDHLYKKERVHLLNHILRMIVEPSATQHPDIQKLGLNVTKLEEVTNEALSTFFSDKDNSNNAKKKPFLKEIFRVAKQEERYKNGEIDGETVVHVMPDDKIPDNYQSDNEDSGAREDDDNVPASMASSLSPHKTTAPHGILTTPSTEHSPAGPLQSGHFVDDLPVRPAHAQYSESITTTELGSEQHHYVEGGGMGVGQAPTIQSQRGLSLTGILGPLQVSRRSSLYNSPTEYSNAPTTSLYNPNNWQTATTAPSGAPMYAQSFTQQQQHHPPPPSTAYVQQQPVTMPHGQSYMGGSFDGLPRYDPNHNAIFRPVAIPHNAVPQSSGYPTYIHPDNRALHVTSLKLDHLGRTLH